MQVSGRLFRSKKILLWLTAAGLCFVVIWVFRGGFLKRPPPESPRPLVLRYGFTLRNTTGHPIRGVRFQVAAPVKQTATQQCQDIRSSRPFRLSRDRLGNQTLHFAGLDFAPRAVKVITVKTIILVSTSPGPAPKPAGRGYLAAERFVQCDHPDIRRLAARLKGRRATDTATALFGWVHGGIRNAGYFKTRRGALFTLQSRKGDCTGQADLFAALCRACGIPARCLAGYICQRSMALNPHSYHNWAEFYENGTWRLADPQGGVFRRRQRAYIAMRIMGPPESCTVGGGSDFDRFAVSRGEIEVRMNLPPAAASGGAV